MLPRMLLRVPQVPLGHHPGSVLGSSWGTSWGIPRGLPAASRGIYGCLPGMSWGPFGNFLGCGLQGAFQEVSQEAISFPWSFPGGFQMDTRKRPGMPLEVRRRSPEG